MTQPAILRLPLLKPLVLAVISALLVACAGTPPDTTQTTASTAMAYGMPTNTVSRTYPHANNPNALLDSTSLDELEGLLEATDMKMVENNALAVQRYGNLWDRMRASFKMDESHYDPRIEAQKSWFTSRQDYLNRLTARASRYLYHTVREAERRNIPAELALLPVIESSYDPLANSNAAAVGLWQFIPSTGRIYGLNQTPTFDGRRDVIESTNAAYDFLTSLYNQFGSWELALAAYNAGPGRIQSAINANAARGLPTDYWSLRLPTETMNYVPRFLAVAQIVKNPSNYGVYLPAIANRQHFRSVPANVGVSLSDISSLTGVEYQELRALNPGLIAGSVDMSGPNRVLIPNEVASSVDKRISNLRGNGFSSVPTYSAAVTYPTQTYTPASSYNATGFTANNLNSAGDNLVAAQQAYNKAANLPTSSSALANYANSLNSVRTQPMPLGNASTITGVEPPISATEQKEITQQVKSETITTLNGVQGRAISLPEPPLTKAEQAVITQPSQSSTSPIAQGSGLLNGKIDLNTIQTQQSILDAKGETKQLSYDGGMGVPTSTGQSTPVLLETPTSIPTTPVKSKPRPKGTRSIYQVKKGDTLKSIASRMGVSWKDIAEWNQIDPNANLMAGVNLYLYNAKPVVIPTKATEDERDDIPDSYVVQSGDTLLGIANKYDLTLSEIASYNNLPTNAAVRTKQTLWLIPGKVKPIAIPSVKPTVTPVKKSTQKIATTSYKVQAGDSLIGLADDYDISTAKLADLNDLEPTDSLLIGQIIKVPTTPKASSKVTSKPATPQKATSPKSVVIKQITYKVKSGDSLTSLAKRYHMTPQELAKKNGIAPNANLTIGQTVKVPSEEDE